MQVMKASKLSFQLVQVEVGGGSTPATLLRMVDSKGQITLVLKQISKHSGQQHHCSSSKQLH